MPERPYRIITGYNASTLEENVSDAIAEGYEPHGDPFVYTKSVQKGPQDRRRQDVHNVELAQAVVAPDQM